MSFSGHDRATTVVDLVTLAMRPPRDELALHGGSSRDGVATDARNGLTTFSRSACSGPWSRLASRPSILARAPRFSSPAVPHAGRQAALCLHLIVHAPWVSAVCLDSRRDTTCSRNA